LGRTAHLYSAESLVDEGRRAAGERSGGFGLPPRAGSTKCVRSFEELRELSGAQLARGLGRGIAYGARGKRDVMGGPREVELQLDCAEKNATVDGDEAR